MIPFVEESPNGIMSVHKCLYISAFYFILYIKVQAIEHAEESRRCYTGHKHFSWGKVMFSFQTSNYLTVSTMKFQSTATIEDQCSLTCCSWLFTGKSHPKVEPLLASCCSRLLIFHDWHFYMPNMSYFACCNFPHLLQSPKKDAMRMCQFKCH